jgi:hypothetical protein
MALVFHHLWSGQSAGADGARANPATVDDTCNRMHYEIAEVAKRAVI